ncbi:MAG: hypothetical protein ACLSFT_08825 [Ruminococcus callidus]
MVALALFYCAERRNLEMRGKNVELSVSMGGNLSRLCGFDHCTDQNGKNVPETFPQLYQLFEKWYTEREKKVPNSVTSFAKCGKSWALSGKKKIQPYLYAFVRKV